MQDLEMYDIGELKDDPWRLYDYALKFSMFYDGFVGDDSELSKVLRKVNHSLWGNLPSVVTIDFRDPDDASSWSSVESSSTIAKL